MVLRLELKSMYYVLQNYIIQLIDNVLYKYICAEYNNNKNIYSN